MIKLIGLAGQARCGKSSMAKFLVDELGYILYPLSHPIKVMMCALFGWDSRHVVGDLKETFVEVSINRQAFLDAWNKCGMPEVFGLHMDNTAFNDLINVLFQDDTADDGPYISPRRAFQLFGTEYGRGRKPTIWLDLAKHKLGSLPEDSGMIIPDIRFPNEQQWASINGGLVVHVRRAGTSHNIGDSGHASEAGLKPGPHDWVTPGCVDLGELGRHSETLIAYLKEARVKDDE